MKGSAQSAAAGRAAAQGPLGTAMCGQSAEETALSPRQAEIAQLVVSGKSTREIASALTLSPRTVETHIAAVFNKYGVSSRAELIIAVLGPLARTSGTAAAHAAHTNLPAPRAGLFGRAADIANIRGLLRESRLVTLSGAGGIGKTRVALAVGQALLAESEAGTWFVDLASLARGSSVADAVARALSIDPSPGVAVIESLRSYLKQQSIVIILDNCEHVIVEAAAAADALLGVCPQLRLLATSREPLRIAGERTYRLPSLQVPPADDAPLLDAPRGTTYASIELFTKRAQEADYNFALTSENVGLVAELCRRTDGIPLAIELAAARVNILPLPALATKLESHLRILGRGERIALPRHQTMHALIDWSYDLLAPQERRLFERLSVFSGGCALPEAVAVYGDDAVDEVAVIDMLSSLVDKSLVTVDATAEQPRYGVLQTFAQYGLEKLTAHGEAAAARRRHAAAYVALAERLEVEYDGGPRMSWFSTAQREVENWRAALNWTLEARHDVLLGQRLVAALRPVWLNVEGAQRWLKLARELTDEQTPEAVSAAVQYATAYINFDFGELEQTVDQCRLLREAYTRLGDPRRAAYLKTWEGTSLFLLGRIGEAEPLLADALGSARENGWTSLFAYLLGVTAQVAFTRGDITNGRVKYAESIAIFESLGADKSVAVGRLNLAEAEFGCGNVDRAIALATDSLTAIRQFGLRTNIAMGLINLAGYCVAADRWEAAYEYAHEAVRIMKDSQHHLFFLVALQHVAAVAVLAPGELEGSSRMLRATQLLGYTDACFARLGYARESNEQRQYDRVLAALCEAYPEEGLTAHLADGAAMAADQAIEAAQAM